VVCLVTDVKKIVNYTVMGRSTEGAEEVDLVVSEISVCMGFFDFVALGGFSHGQETDL
jgi:hypothetical protein